MPTQQAGLKKCNRRTSCSNSLTWWSRYGVSGPPDFESLRPRWWAFLCTHKPDWGARSLECFPRLTTEFVAYFGFEAKNNYRQRKLPVRRKRQNRRLLLSVAFQLSNRPTVTGSTGGSVWERHAQDTAYTCCRSGDEDVNPLSASPPNTCKWGRNTGFCHLILQVVDNTHTQQGAWPSHTKRLELTPTSSSPYFATLCYIGGMSKMLWSYLLLD